MSNGLTDFFLNGSESFINLLTSGKLLQIFGQILLGVGVLIWLYCGLKVFLDARRRFTINIGISLLFLVFGILTGPIGLLLYILTRPKYSQEELEYIRIEHKFYYEQASKILDCLQCGAYVTEEQTYCTNCGTQNRFKCENCKALTDYDDNFCHNCGKSFEGRFEKIVSGLDKKIEKRIKKTKKKKDREVKSVKVSTVFSKLNQSVRKDVLKAKEVIIRIISGVKGKIRFKDLLTKLKSYRIVRTKSDKE